MSSTALPIVRIQPCILTQNTYAGVCGFFLQNKFATSLLAYHTGGLFCFKANLANNLNPYHYYIGTKLKKITSAKELEHLKTWN